MGDGFHHAQIQPKGVFDDLLAVAGGGRAADHNAREFLVQGQKKFLHQRHGVSGIRQVPGENDLLIFVDGGGL